MFHAIRPELEESRFSPRGKFESSGLGYNERILLPQNIFETFHSIDEVLLLSSFIHIISLKHFLTKH